MNILDWDLKTTIIVFGTIWLATFLLYLGNKRRDKLNIFASLNNEYLRVDSLDLNKNHKFKYKIDEKIFIFLSFVIVSLVQGLQTSNSDYDSYGQLYLIYSQYYDFLRFESLYKALNRFVYVVFNDYTYLRLIISIITNYFAYKNVLYYTKLAKTKSHQALFLYLSVFYLVSFGMLRQIVATNIVVFSFKYVGKKQYATYFVLTLLAMGFHTTAAFSFIFVLFASIHVKSKIKLVTIRISTVALFYILVCLAPRILNIISIFSGRTYDIYVVSEEIGFGNIITRSPLILFLLLFRKEIRNSPKIVRLLTACLVFEILIVFTYYIMPILGGRVQYFVLFGYAILIPYCIQNDGGSENKQSKFSNLMSSLCVYLFGTYYMVLLMLSTGWITTFLMPIKFARLW